MAESNLATDDLGERYAALELAYTEDRWPDVLQQGESLIADLSTTSDPQREETALDHENGKISFSYHLLYYY
jgi:hypothetical protein